VGTKRTMGKKRTERSKHERTEKTGKGLGTNKFGWGAKGEQGRRRTERRNITTNTWGVRGSDQKKTRSELQEGKERRERSGRKGGIHKTMQETRQMRGGQEGQGHEGKGKEKRNDSKGTDGNEKKGKGAT
jgi:hypothetical protein